MTATLCSFTAVKNNNYTFFEILEKEFTDSIFCAEENFYQSKSRSVVGKNTIIII